MRGASNSARPATKKSPGRLSPASRQTRWQWTSKRLRWLSGSRRRCPAGSQADEFGTSAEASITFSGAQAQVSAKREAPPPTASARHAASTPRRAVHDAGRDSASTPQPAPNPIEPDLRSQDELRRWCDHTVRQANLQGMARYHKECPAQPSYACMRYFCGRHIESPVDPLSPRSSRPDIATGSTSRCRHY